MMGIMTRKNLDSYLYLLICQGLQLIVFLWSRCETVAHGAKAIFLPEETKCSRNFIKLPLRVTNSHQAGYDMKPEVSKIVSTSPL